MRSTRPPFIAMTLVGDLVALSTLWLAVQLAGTATWRAVDDAARGDVDRRTPAVQALRGVAGPFGVPALAVLLLVLTVVAWRRSRRDAVVLLLVAVGGSATVQLLSSAGLPALGDLGALSGHIGVASAVGLGWVVVCRRSPARTAGLALGVTGAMVTAMVLAGWHSVPEVVGSVGIPAGWAIGALGLLPRSDGAQASAVPARPRPGGAPGAGEVSAGARASAVGSSSRAALVMVVSAVVVAALGMAAAGIVAGRDHGELPGGLALAVEVVAALGVVCLAVAAVLATALGHDGLLVPTWREARTRRAEAGLVSATDPRR